MSKLSLTEISAYAFDFDGTLADTVPTHTEARKAAFEQMAEETGNRGFVTISPEIQKEAHRHGSNPTAIIGWALEASGIVPNVADPLVKRTVDTKREMYEKLCKDGLEQMPGAVELARFLLQRSPGRVAITTTAYRDAEVVPFLNRYNLRNEITDEKLITYEDVGDDHLKPDPRAYQITIARFGLTDSPEKLVAFEDTPGGVASAKAAGATAIALLTTHSEADFAGVHIGSQADLIVPNFQSLIDMFKSV